MVGSPSVRAALLAATIVAHGAHAQANIQPTSVQFWATAGAAITAAALLDERARTFWLERHSGFGHTLADAGNAMGAGRNIIVGLAATYLVARVTHHRRTGCFASQRDTRSRTRSWESSSR